MRPRIDETDRRIVNLLQDGLEISSAPFAGPAATLGLTEDELLARLARLREIGVLSRVGPLYNAERLGGGLTLCAMAVPPDRFDEVAEIVNGFPEVAHNYERDHPFNMWFVLATEAEARAAHAIADIEGLTGVKVLNLPKLDEYFIGLKVEA